MNLSTYIFRVFLQDILPFDLYIICVYMCNICSLVLIFLKNLYLTLFHINISMSIVAVYAHRIIYYYSTYKYYFFILLDQFPLSIDFWHIFVRILLELAFILTYWILLFYFCLLSDLEVFKVTFSLSIEGRIARCLSDFLSRLYDTQRIISRQCCRCFIHYFPISICWNIEQTVSLYICSFFGMTVPLCTQMSWFLQKLL